MGDDEEQTDELTALRSIYDDEEVFSATQESGLNVGFMSVDVEIPHPFNVTLNESEDVPNIVENLPSIILTFSLPHDYPSLNPPNFSLSCPWLTDFQLSNLTEELLQMWTNNTGSVILFTWIGFLQTEILTFLDIKSPMILSEQNLQIVLEFDRSKRIRIFDHTVFCCPICLGDKPGSACLQFLKCSHVFCRTCLKHFFETYIENESVNLLKCPDDKCNTPAHPTQVKELVRGALFERYDRLMFQLSLDTMNDIMYCPRKSCGSPVIVDADQAMGSCAECFYVFCIHCQKVYHGISKCQKRSEGGISGVADNFDDEDTAVICPRPKCGWVVPVTRKIARGYCEQCHYEFCIYCKMNYHGLARCHFKSEATADIRTAYLSSDDTGKWLLERKYGAKFLQKILEEYSTENWLREYSKKCPKCGTNIQKNGGCNKMTCSKCNVAFCWLCLAVLPFYNHEGIACIDFDNQRVIPRSKLKNDLQKTE